MSQAASGDESSERIDLDHVGDDTMDLDEGPTAPESSQADLDVESGINGALNNFEALESGENCMLYLFLD